MPYITQKEREALSSVLDPLLRHVEQGSLDCELSVGALNYIITKLCISFLRCGDEVEPCYTGLNEICGVLECCKLEFVRRAINVYEDEKIKLEGDVY